MNLVGDLTVIIWMNKYLENWTKSEDNRRQITWKTEIFYHGELGVVSMLKIRKLGMGMMDGYQWIALTLVLLNFHRKPW